MKEPGIVLVTTSYPIARDGSEAAGSFVSDLAAELARHLPTRVVAPGPEDRVEEAVDGVQIHRYAAPDKPLSNLRPWRPRDLIALAGIMRGGLAATHRATAAGPTTHLLALWALPSGHWARQVSRRAGIPYSVWTLGSDIWSLGRLPLVRAWLRKVIRDAAVCYSDGLRLADDTGRIGGRAVEFLPSTRRIQRRRLCALKQEPPYRLLFLGRWHPNKGVDLLIEALERLENDDWQRIESVDICGGGPLEPIVLAGVKRLCAKRRPVVAHGYLAKSEAEDAIVRADYLLIPSRIESIPVVFSDAVKLGCAVLATPVGDLERLIERVPNCGMVAPAVDAHAFARLISSALRMNVSRFADGIAATAASFELETSVQRLHSLSIGACGAS